MELFKLFGTILVDNDAANKSIAKTEQNADKSGSNMMNTFKKVGAAVIAGFLSQKVIEFGKQCVETAASIKASKSQFEQTFGDMQNTANENMQKIADSSGILKTRLQDVGTSYTHLLKQQVQTVRHQWTLCLERYKSQPIVLLITIGL